MSASLGRSWTPEEEDELRSLILASKDIATIAKELNRTQTAIRRKASKLKLTFKVVGTRAHSAMPLKRGRVVGYDAGRMSYKFTMWDSIETVHCEISVSALHDLIGDHWGNVLPSDRDAQFLKFRDVIERIASDLFDATGANPIRIFAKHLPRNKGPHRYRT